MFSFVRCIFCIVEMVMRFLSFILLMCITFIDLYMWTILASLEKMPQVHGVCVSGILVCDFLFLQCLLGLWNQDSVDDKKESGKCSLLFSILDEFWEALAFSHVFWNSPVKPSWPGLLGFRFWDFFFFLIDSLSWVVIDLLRFLFLHDLVLVIYIFLGTYPIL